MSWDTITPTRKAWNRHQGYELRLTSKTIGYLNANAREFLFKGKRTGAIVFEQESTAGRMSIVPRDDGIRVNENGHLAVSSITLRTAAPLPISILLVPFEDEQRLIFAGVRK
jgi:hypothetical protein